MNWLVDTQLVADWVLWNHADDARSTARATSFSALRIRTDLQAFERLLSNARVLLALSVVVEAAGVIRRELGHPHRGLGERLNEPVVRSMIRFSERFKPEIVQVSEGQAGRQLAKLNQGVEARSRFDLGDAALVAALEGERRLLTADAPLRTRCVNMGRTDVFQFASGKILDPRGIPIRAS